jgi:ribonucleoside-diphosphate reductase alpha chain
VEKVMETGSCQGIEETPQPIRQIFAVSADITAEEHVRMQAAMQAFVDNSLSKTVNFPATATEKDVATAYRLAWKQGCKGITVYVTGSREVVVLETKQTAKQKQSAESTVVTGAAEKVDGKEKASEQIKIWSDSKKPRPKQLHGYTFNIGTPLGKAFVTINENGGDQPFEVFINTSKAGSDTAAVSEAIGRLISYVLRLASPIVPRDRLHEVVRQLSGIGGGRSLGFGPNRVRSLPDGVAHVLNEYLQMNADEEDDLGEVHPAVEPHISGNGNGYHAEEGISLPRQLELQPQPATMKIGDLCPECGEAAVVNEEGCRKCYACGFSEC